MKKYYINIANQQQGPYSLEDLKEKGITRETMVWFEGAENWQRANKIDELKDLFKTIPPPITTSNTATPPPLPNKPKSNKTAMYVILAGIVFIMIVGLTLLSSHFL